MCGTAVIRLTKLEERSLDDQSGFDEDLFRTKEIPALVDDRIVKKQDDKSSLRRRTITHKCGSELESFFK
jgi:hypothetical protein